MLAICAEHGIDRVALLEAHAHRRGFEEANTIAEEPNLRYSVEKIDGRLVITGPCEEKPGARSQVYIPPNCLARLAYTWDALNGLAANLNMAGCYDIGAVMAFEGAYNRRVAEIA